jgi:long-chain acyl-CoA synthetase
MLDSFLSLAENDPAATAVIDAATGAAMTRRELADRAHELAAGLRDAGMAPRDAVAVQLPNSGDFIAAVLAATALDLLIVPIDRDSPETELAATMRHFGVRGLIFRPDRLTTVVSTRGTDGRPSVPADARLIKLTSGSTGLPKGIVTTEANLRADATNICRTMKIGPDDVNLGAIPFSHSYGFSNLVTPLLIQGTAVVVTNDYLPQTLLELANRHRCTVAPLIPMVYSHLTSAAHGRFETVRTFISAGAPLPAATSRGFRERFGVDIQSFYGCSECGGISYDRRGAAVERGTVGTALDGVTLLTDGARLRVRSESVAAGYLIDVATFEPFARDVFTTDDLVAELDGEIVLTGRASDMINTAGKKVNPREIETILLQIEGVREARVYGAEAGARGEVVAAAIVATPEVTREQVREFCLSRLAPHKVPRIVKLIDELPVDGRGKVKRTVLEAL